MIGAKPQKVVKLAVVSDSPLSYSLIFEIDLAKNKVERKLNFPGARVEKARPFYSYSLLIYNLNLRL